MAQDIHAQSVPLPKFPMSALDLGYSLKLCTDMGRMNCHYVEEVIPSDIAHIKTDIFCRLDPLTFPIMHKVKVRQNFFFVPSRLIMGDDKQEEFFSCKDLGAKLTSVTIDPSSSWGYDPLGRNSLFDQMECQPVINQSGVSMPKLVRNPIPFLSYQCIWANWYADEVYDSVEIATFNNMLDSYKQLALGNTMHIVYNALTHPFVSRRVTYSKDRFTSAQPDAQRVGEVYLMNPLEFGPSSGLPSTNASAIVTPGGNLLASGNTTPLRSTLTIDELWDEMAVQRLLNSFNEFGNERYTEILAGQYGIISADARLQRPQWLGGNEMVVNISEVLQTSETTSSSPLGALGGRGIVAGRGRDITFKVPEHGYIIGILTFVPENGYASGSPRWVYKSTPLDFAIPRLNNLGEQAVYTGELFSDHLQDSTTGDLAEFGYQPQYDEYRSHPSRATGDFRDTAFLPWHLDRKFTSVPPLNDQFIRISRSETNRIFNDTDPDAEHFRVHAFHKAMYVRPISKHPVPGKL